MIEHLESYKSYIRNDLGYSENTVYGYYKTMRRIITRLNLKTPEDVKATILNKRLIDEFWTISQEHKKYTAQTRVNYLAALKMFIRFLFIRGMISEDISGRITMPKRDILFLEGLTKEDQKKLRQYLAENLKTELDLRNTALIYFLWGTATRISEALKLNCHPESYIYTGNPKVISGNFHVDDGKVYVHISGKAHRNRIIRVPDEVVMYLNLYLDNRKIKNEILFQNIKRNKHFHKYRLSRPGTRNILMKVFKEAEIKKTPSLCTHMFRHTAINHWIEQGHSDQEISAMAGLLPGSIIIYRNRNKKLTDIFGGKSKALPNLDDKRLTQFEQTIRKRYYEI